MYEVISKVFLNGNVKVLMENVGHASKEFLRLS